MVEITFLIEEINDELGYQYRARSVENGSILWVKISMYSTDPREERRNKRYSDLLYGAKAQKERVFIAKCHVNGDWHIIEELKEI